MIKEELASRVSRRTNYSNGMVLNVIDTMTDIITDTLAKGGRVQLYGFGTFEPAERAARIGRNPHTREEVKIPARVVPVFRAGENLKKAVIKPCE